MTAVFTASDLDMPNPERGFYSSASSASPWVYTKDWTQSILASKYASGLRLLRAVVYLGDYRGTMTLPQSLLDDLTSKLALLRAGGMKAIILMAYNYDNNGADANSLPILLNHVAQVGAVLKANADVVPYVIGGGIGPFGETWQGTASNAAFFTSDARLQWKNALVAALAPTQFLMIRYPKDIMAWWPTVLTEGAAFVTGQAQVGMRNDCMGSGGGSDLDDDGLADGDTGTWLNIAQVSYEQQLSRFTPYGGETCVADAPTRSAGAIAIREGKARHLTFQNLDYSLTHINAWKADGSYPEISRSMGYRFQLDQISHAGTIAKGESTPVSIDLRDVGWSRIFSARALVVTLKNRTTGAVITASGGDLRKLDSQATTSTRITVPVAVPSGAASGIYDVFISAPDIFPSIATDRRFAVRFANTDSGAQKWDDTNGRFATGTSVTVP